MDERKETDYQFKILYAIGIVLVVANHCGYNGGGVSLFYELFPAYSFHIGLFVFCSGYFYNEAAEHDLMAFIKKKFTRLIIPLYVWNFTYALIAQIMSLRGFNIGAGITFEKLFIKPITDGHQFQYNLPSWFVAPLFMTEVFYVLYRKTISFIDKRFLEHVCMLGSLMIGMAGIYLSCRGYNKDLWLIITRMAYFVPFYSAGCFYKKKLKNRDTLSNTMYFFVIVSLQLAVIFVNGHTLVYEQAWTKFEKFDAWPFVVGFLGIAFWLRISRILEPAVGRSRTVNLIADNTYSIMINHLSGFMLVNSVFALGYRYTTCLFQDFSWYDYHSDIRYYYRIKGLEQTCLIYIFVGIVFSIIVQILINRLNCFIKEKLCFSKKKVLLTYSCACMLIFISSYAISGYVDNRGGVQIPPGNVYKPGTELLFGSFDNNITKYYETGLTVPEDTYTWTEGNEVKFNFALSETEKNYMLELCTGVYGERQKVDVLVNDELLDSIIVNNSQEEYKVLIPGNIVNMESEISLKLELPDAVSPLELGEGEDPRPRALSIRKLVIQPLS